jgi:hypothetical protein
LGRLASRIAVGQEVGSITIEEDFNTTDFSEADGNSGHAHCERATAHDDTPYETDFSKCYDFATELST